MEIGEQTPDRNRSDEGMRNIKQKLQKLSAWALAAAMLWSSFEVALPAKAADGEDNAAILASAEISDEIQAKTTEVGDGYGTAVYNGTTGSCTWTLYDSDGDGTEDLLVIGGTEAMPDYNVSYMPPWDGYRENIKKLVVEEGVTGLGEYAFDKCANLKDVTLPSTLVIIGKLAFRRCESLNNVVIPSGVTEIGIGAFERCSSLVSVTFPDTLKNIRRNAFLECGLVEIEIPEGLETIGDGAFIQCYSLQSVILPDTLITIEQYAFYLDSKLTIIIPESVQTIGDSAFYKANSVYNLSDCDIDTSSSTRKVNHDKITLVENGESAEQRVLPAKYVAGTRYAGTKYDASYYYSSGEGNTAWYVQNGDTYEKVTSATSFQNTPTFYYAKPFDDTTAEINASGSSEDSYTLVVKDKETDETLTEGTHYTQEITDSTDWEETDTGSLTKTVTVTVTGVAEGGYVGTMQTSFLINTHAEASVTADGGTKKYPVLEDAWKAAQGKTAEVTLLTDVEVGETLTVTNGSEITLKSEKNGDGDYTVSGNVLNNESGMIDVAAGGIFILGSGNIENGKNGNNAIAVNGGTFVMNGGSAVALADGHSGVCVYSGGKAEINGGNAEGYNGLAVVNGGSATVSGGTFTGTYLVANNSAAVLLRNSDGTLQTMLGEGKAYYEVKDGKKTLITDLDGQRLYGTVTVEDCTHSCESWADAGETHIGNCIVCNAEMEEEHNWDESGKCTADGCTAQAAACVTVNGGKAVYYTTIETAWQVAKGHSEGATVTLLTDAEIKECLKVEKGDNITLSMHDGVTLSNDGSHYMIEVHGGSFTLESGTLHAIGDSYAVVWVNGGTFVMNGGTVSGYMGIYQSSNSDIYNGGSVFITNGTISGTVCGFFSNDCSAVLTGGTFSGGSLSISTFKEKTVGDILGNGYAYRQNGTWVNDTTVTELKGTVTVEEAPIKSVTIEGTENVYVDIYRDIILTANVELSDAYEETDVSYEWECLSDGWYMWGDFTKRKTFEHPTYINMVGTLTFTCKVTCDGYTVTAKPFSVNIIDPNAEVISVEVSWDALEYTYTDGAWNPDTHSYEEGEWTADGGNSVTVKNTGNVEVTADYQYSPTVTDVSGSFADEVGNPINSPAALPEGEEKKAYLTLTGKPQEGFNGTLGTVTVTIGTGGGE